MNINVNKGQYNKISKQQQSTVAEISAAIEPCEEKEFNEFLNDEPKAPVTQKESQVQNDKNAEFSFISQRPSPKLDIINANYLKMQQDILCLKDFKVMETKDEFFVDLKNVDSKDVEFFKTVVDNQNFMINLSNPVSSQISLQIPTEGGISYKSIDVSKGLLDMIQKASQTNKHVRLSFDDNSSVILKVNKDGLLTASFMSNDSAMEQMLKANLPFLRNKMDAENIPYKEISYKDRNNKKDDNKGGDKDE